MSYYNSTCNSIFKKHFFFSPSNTFYLHVIIRKKENFYTHMYGYYFIHTHIPTEN